jgi:AraC-like DNA-binding protein
MTVQLVGSAFRLGQDAGWRPDPAQDRPAGVQVLRLGGDEQVARARVAVATVLVMIDGTLWLSSYRGRERLQRGMIAIRPSFDARALRAESGGATWLQFPWGVDWSLGATHELPDVDRMLLAAAHDLHTAKEEVSRIMESEPSRAAEHRHWVDGLHRAMLSDPHLSISGWARTNRVSREAAARGFRAAYDVRPSRFRLELRARNAWARIVVSDDPLSVIALETGFADQSHMTRAVGWLTGRSPSAWRRKG